MNRPTWIVSTAALVGLFFVGHLAPLAHAQSSGDVALLLLARRRLHRGRGGRDQRGAANDSGPGLFLHLDADRQGPGRRPRPGRANHA